MNSVHGKQRTACWSPLHSLSFFTVVHLCLKISACNSHYFDPACALLDFERNDNTILRTAGREPPSSGSAFSQRHSFSGEQSRRLTKSLNGSKGGLCYKRNYSYWPHLSISLPSELASSLTRQHQTRAKAVWGILNLH